MKSYFVGSHIIYTISVLENGHTTEYQGNTDNWFQAMGESWEPVFFNQTSEELDTTLKIYKDNQE